MFALTIQCFMDELQAYQPEMYELASRGLEKMKKIVVNPGGSLGLQMHYHRVNIGLLLAVRPR